ncbi:MAG: dephospho-CoA kinase [Bdellovibrionales bacterium]|nr:dephospho-CoA kinase [Bdellovibrionales bacterium]
MKWFGLTGGLGCGKSLVTEIIRRCGYPVVDADRIVHHLYDTDLDLQMALSKTFGLDIFDNGKVVRGRLVDIIKSDISKKKILESLIHPKVSAKVDEIKARLERNKAKMAFYDIPLLFENNLDAKFDATIFINAPAEMVYQRLAARNAWTKEEVNVRQSWLLSNKEKSKRATYVIENDGSISMLEEKVEHLLEELVK